MTTTPTTRRSIKIMADYDCHPIWWDSAHPEWHNTGNGALGDIDPATIGVSSRLAGDLSRWAEQFNAILNRADPTGSGFPSAQHEQAFHEQGRLLARRVQEELSRDFSVRYWRDELSAE
jgi:hypothetical protein